MNELTEQKPARAKALASVRVDFEDHASFHGTVARAMLGGGAGTLLADLVARIAGLHLAALPLFSVAVLGGVLAAVGAKGRHLRRAILAGLSGIAGGLAFALISPLWPWFGAGLMGLALAPFIARGESPKRMLVTALLGAGLGYAGIFVGRVLVSQELLSGLVPGPIAHAAAGAAAGLFLGLASVARHVARPADPVESAYRPFLAATKGEVREILGRALSIHVAVKQELRGREGEASIRRLEQSVTDSALRLLRIAEQCRRIDAELELAPLHELDERIAGLESKADTTKDPTARQTYLDAAETLRSQKRSFDTVQGGRDRVVARLHANVALLEKLRFSLIHLRSADAERWGTEIAPILEVIEELSREIDATSTAVGEVFGQKAPALAAGKDISAEAVAADAG